MPNFSDPPFFAEHLPELLADAAPRIFGENFGAYLDLYMVDRYTFQDRVVKRHIFPSHFLP